MSSLLPSPPPSFPSLAVLCCKRQKAEQYCHASDRKLVEPWALQVMGSWWRLGYCKWWKTGGGFGMRPRKALKDFTCAMYHCDIESTRPIQCPGMLIICATARIWGSKWKDACKIDAWSDSNYTLLSDCEWESVLKTFPWVWMIRISFYCWEGVS